MKNANIISPTAARIFAAWEKQGRAETPRRYLGASIVGHECEMYLWLNFRGVVRENFNGRMYRLFDRGKREEAVFCDDLRRIGCEVREFDEHGNQFEVNDLGGHFSGHLDGIVRGLPESPKEWHVVEFKTHSDASFKKLCKEGVAKAKPMHYAQMTVYMGKTGLKRAIYMAVNKDTDELWIERIEFDQNDYERIMERARHIIDTVQPDRCARRSDDFRCKACPCASVCWHTADTFVDPSIPETCRTCCHATADTEHDGANWMCRLGHACTHEGTCEDYLILPLFVKGEVVEGDEKGILYEFEKDGKTSGITIGKRGVSVAEAKRFGQNEWDGVRTLKNSFPGATVTSSNNLEMKYTSASFEVYFSGSQDAMLKWHETMPGFDMSSPIASEDDGDKSYYEYRGGWCVCHDKKKNLFTVYGDKPPF